MIYKGELLSPPPKNTIGVIQFKVQLSEIVSHYDGMFQKILSQQNAEKRRDEYYSKIGESQERLEGHITYFGKPDFVLGTILKEKNGKFTYSSEVSQDIEQFLFDEREEDKYAYIGSAQIGEATAKKQDSGPIQFIRPFEYEDVVLWTDGKK